MKGGNFENKVVVVTGGASGIGAAIGYEFGRHGARIALLDFDVRALRAAEKRFRGDGIEVLARRCDVTDRTECERSARAVTKRFGGIDVLVNNAGITQRSLFRKTDVEVIRRVMEVNFYGSVNCTKAALESLIGRGGMIIVVTSIAGVAPLYGRTGYAASKHALHGFFDSLRSELRGNGVHVMMVSPGFTATNLQNRALDGDGSINLRRRSIVGGQDTPEHVAQAVFEGARKRRRAIILTGVGKISYYASRFFPVFYENKMVRAVEDEFEEQSVNR